MSDPSTQLRRHMFKNIVTPLCFKYYDQVLEGFSTFFESSLFMYDRVTKKKKKDRA